MPGTIRVVRMVLLHGVSWYGDESVALAEIAGAIRPESWTEAVALVDRVLPSGVAGPLPAPGSTAAAVAILGAEICRWGGFAVRPATPRPPDRIAERWAGLPLRFDLLMREALNVAAEALDVAEEGGGEDWIAPTRARLLSVKAEADQWMIGSRRLIAAAAAARGIPCRAHGSLRSVLVLGEGRFGHRYDATATPRTSALATSIGVSKRRTSLLLSRGGIPVARQVAIADREAAHRAADRFGYPLVLKPATGRLQQGVSIVFRPEDVDAAYDLCVATGMDVLAESFIPGREFRALVVGGRLVSVIEQVAARVVGDGRSTIAALVETANLDRRRGPVAEGFPMRKIAWNETTLRFLAFTGRSPADVPAEGEVVQTYPLPMLRYGGELKVDVTDDIHPETASMLERAVALVGLEVAGIDFRIPDITQSWRATGAGICEINPQPNLGIHYSLAGGPRRDVAGMILDRTLPSPPGRMTHVAVVAGGEGAAVARAIRDALVARGDGRVGLATPGGVEIDGLPVSRVPPGFHEVVGLMIEDPTLDAAVYAVAPATIARFGIGLSRLDAAVMGPPDQATSTLDRTARAVALAAGAAIVALDSRPLAAIVEAVLARLAAARDPGTAHARPEGAGA